MLKKAVSIAFLLLCAAIAGAQTKDPSLVGTDFWVGFLLNEGNNLSLLIASEDNCIAHIECSSPVYSNTVEILPNRIVKVDLPGSFLESGLHVTTTAPAVVYASNYSQATHDMSAVLPTSALKCNYITQNYGNNGEVAIVAPFDSTDVQIVSRGGSTQIITLQRGDVYLMQNISSSTGISSKRIHSSRPVAVFQGSYCTTVGATDCCCCDHLYEQCFPTEYWGRRFMVVPTTGRSPASGQHLGCDMVIVTSRDDDCFVNIGGRRVGPLSAGESYRFFMADNTTDIPYSPQLYNIDYYQSDALYVETTKPVTVCYYISSMTFGGRPGDPASVIVPPLEQGVNYAIAAVYNTPNTQQHFINIVTRASDVPFITIDGVSVLSNFTETPEGYAWARFTIDTGTHVIDARGGSFLATFYGLGFAESYAYIAGAAMYDISYNVQADCHNLCSGDTATFIVTFGSSRSHSEWKLDGQPLGTDLDTVRLAFDTTGVHHLEVFITPLGDIVREDFSVNSSYSVFKLDTLCPGNNLNWQGHALDTAGFYIDTLQTVHGCDSVLTLQLTVLNAPQAVFALDTDCAHYAYRIFALAEGDTTGYSISWHASPPDAALVDQPWDSLYLLPQQTTAYSLHIEGPCPSDTSVTLNPIRMPVADMAVRPPTLSIDHLSFEAYDQSQNTDTRRWWIDGSFVGDNPVLRYTADYLVDSLLLMLEASNEACADTLVRAIPIEHNAVWVPNAFTPDEPSNNLFAPVLNECTTEEMYIFNRQGFLIAHIVGDRPSWDGMHDGIPCPQGTYVWRLYYHTDREPDRRKERFGTVLLLR